MTTAATGRTPASDNHAGDVIARHAGFVRDLVSVATRALRQIPREPEGLWGLAVTGSRTRSRSRPATPRR